MKTLLTRTLGLSLLALGCGVSGTAIAQTVEGQVTDATGEAPLEGAIITIEELDRSETTDRRGEYRFVGIPAGTYNFTVSYIGTGDVSTEVSVPADGTTADFILGEDVRYLDNVLVVGFAAAQAGAINQQRAANSIISVIDSDGLGNFPDTTVADSLARVPGLSIETDQGEGRYVSIRGINTDLVAATINGVRTPSPEDRRGVLLDGVPSDLLDGIEVQKSLTPDVDGDSLGGVVNLKTISAFDRDGRYVRLKAEGRYNDINEEVSPKATLTYTDVFADTFGVALSLNYQDLRIEAHNNEAGEFDFTDDGIAYMNDEFEHRWYGLNRERIGLVANFDWKATPGTDLYLRTLINEYEDDEVRNSFTFRDLDDVEDAVDEGTGSITEDGIFLPLNEMEAAVRVRRETRQIQTIALGGSSNFDLWTVDYEASYAYAEEDDSDNHDVAFRFEDIQDSFPGGVAISRRQPTTPRVGGSRSVIDAIYDPSNYDLDEFEREFSVNEDTEYGAKIDITRDSLIGDMPVTWKAGAKYRDREKIRDVNILLFEPDLNLGDFARDSFIRGWRLANPQPTWPDPDLTRALRPQFSDTTGEEYQAEASFFDSTGEDYVIEEQILAGYVMGTFDIGALNLVAGVRVEQTDVDLSGFFVLEDSFDATERKFSNDFTNVLPSVNAKYNFTDKLIGRAAYYAAAVRPAFGEVAPFVFVNDDRDEAELGNPALDPYEADNFDISLEFYPTELSLISIGAFYKEISDAIFPATYDIGDVPTSVDVSFLPETVEEVATFINVGDSEISGVELNYVQGLGDLAPGLEGFLVSANATFTDSDTTLPDGRTVPFLKQSETIWNVAVGYDRGPLDLRISANYRGDYLDELVDEDLDRTTDDRLLVEASAKFQVTDAVQIYLEGKNLTDAPEYYYFGNDRRLSQYDEFGTSVILGAQVTF